MVLVIPSALVFATVVAAKKWFYALINAQISTLIFYFTGLSIVFYFRQGVFAAP